MSRISRQSESGITQCIVIDGIWQHGQCMAFEDTNITAADWARFQRVMRVMSFITLIAVIASCIALYRINGYVSIHIYIATAIGVGLTMLLMSLLMGLVFLSNSSGHDQDVIEPKEDEEA